MIRYDRRSRLLASGLAALAGFVDATGFLKMGGFFVSFMSGNSTRLAVSIAERSPLMLAAGGLILAFVAGVVAGYLLAAKRAAGHAVSILTVVALVLTAASVAGANGADRVALGLMAFAMGCANSVFQRDGEVSIGVTYMTGALVKMGQRVAAAMLGGDRMAWCPYLFLWLGLVLGGALGAAAYARLGFDCLWVAAVFAGLLAIWSRGVATRPAATA